MHARRFAPGALVATALATAPGIAGAGPIEFDEQRDTYMIFNDDGTVEFANWFERDPFFAGYQAVEDGFLSVHADDSQFLIIYTTWDLFGAGALYQAVANDVEGIGYPHIAASDPVIPAPIFDDTPNSQVFGFMHMNNWTNYLGGDPGGLNDSRISLIFGQELGHAWLAFPWFKQGNSPSQDTMLGRQEAHWSFYLHSGGSPIEGHDWQDNKDGTYTAIKHDEFKYSDLDLYLMGLMPATDVQPWFLLENPTNCVDSSKMDGSCASPNSHQFEADQYQVTADRIDITIDDVIAAEGPRVPAFGDAPDTFDISFLLIKRADEELTEDEKLLMDAIVDRSIEIWEDQTRGFGHLINRTAIGGGGTGTGGGTGGGSDSGATGSSGGTASGGGTGTASSGGSTTQGSGTGETTDGGDTDADTDGGGSQDGASSCSCRGSGGGWSAGLGLVVLGAIRRRR